MKSKRKNYTKSKLYINLSIYLKSLNKQLQPRQMLTKQVVLILNEYIADVMTQTIDIAVELNGRSKRKTLLVPDIQYAIRILLPKTLVRFAEREGAKSLILFNVKESNLIPI